MVARTLRERGMQFPFPVQASVIPDALEGRDVLVKSPTGSGKTLALGVPLVDLIDATDARAAALVLAPTRELVSQIVEAIRPLAEARALSVAAVYGGVGLEKQARLARKAHILVATPGRLEDLIGRGAVRLDRVRVLALDEADRMLDMGFRPAVDRIVAQVPRDRQTLFLSATLEGEAGRIAAQYTRDARRHEHSPKDGAKADIEHRFVAVAHEDKLDSLVRALRGDDSGRTLVFVRTKRGADRLVKRLAKQGVDSAAMHGDKSQNQREKALRRFHDGRLAALVATDVAARGIDVDDVTQVINFDAPEDRETYVHRIGRTGRAGRTGVGLTFVMRDQARDVAKIAHELRLHDQFADCGLSGPPVGTVRHGERRHPSRRGRRSRVR
ncbi:MAG TPA: DEAD/DEAH box helicase [Thermoleophilaceae bacterium]|nr:DEAD/DEAH box helicase [Thermoleophilaceae bacterium]